MPMILMWMIVGHSLTGIESFTCVSKFCRAASDIDQFARNWWRCREVMEFAYGG